MNRASLEQKKFDHLEYNICQLIYHLENIRNPFLEGAFFSEPYVAPPPTHFTLQAEQKLQFSPTL